MHEWGKKFVLSYAATPADTMKELYRVDEWIAHYRDDPPTLLMTKTHGSTQRIGTSGGMHMVQRHQKSH